MYQLTVFHAETLKRKKVTKVTLFSVNSQQLVPRTSSTRTSLLITYYLLKGNKSNTSYKFFFLLLFTVSPFSGSKNVKELFPDEKNPSAIFYR